MNTPIPKMTKIQEHFEDSNLELDLSKDADGNYLDEVARYAWMNWVTAYSFGREHRANILNKAIEIALAEQQESEYITAEQARELGAGNAEFHKPVPAYQSLNEWDVVGYTHQYSHHNKYRPIKQAQPEQRISMHQAMMLGKDGAEYFNELSQKWFPADPNTNHPYFKYRRAIRSTSYSAMTSLLNRAMLAIKR